MSEQLTYHDVESLENLSLDDLQALWELVPTDRQRSYRNAYEREVKNAGAMGSDVLEKQVAEALLERYIHDALVPVGTRWARTPERVQIAARDNALPDDGTESSTKFTLSPRTLIGGAVIALILVALLFTRLTGGGADSGLPEVTDEPTNTPTLEFSPTPTPLALEAQDDVITGGDAARELAYPVNLQVVLPERDVPRVWVVQRRGVSAAEWNFDPNPDIASFVNGMSVRPVIGIPFSEENADWFAEMDDGAIFTLTMNTGAILRFEFADKTEVRRSDTRIFRQVGPGLVLLLIGEMDEDGLPTATRTLVTATYPPEQELARLDELLALMSVGESTPEPTATPTPDAPIASNLDVQVVSATTQDGRLTTRLRIYNAGTEAVTFAPDDVWLALGYAENPAGPRSPAEGLRAFTLLPEQAVDLTLIWAWDGEPFASLGVGDWRFGIIVAR